ncbi:MAG: hypothetical protein R6W83_09845, partial [Cryobacterium sp.]
MLSAQAATAIRRGLGEHAEGVSEDLLTRALAGFIPEGATLNADQATKAARALRDRIAAAGIASRYTAMKARQYLRVWDTPDGVPHGNFELDPENGSISRDFMLQVAGPRRGGPRFTAQEDQARAKALRDDPRPTDRIIDEALIEALRIAAKADPMQVNLRPESALKIVVGFADPEPTTPEPTAPESADPESASPVPAPVPAPSRVILPPERPTTLTRLTGFIEGTSEAVPCTTPDRLICTEPFTPDLHRRPRRDPRRRTATTIVHPGTTRRPRHPRRRLHDARLPQTTQLDRSAPSRRLGRRRRPDRPRRRHHVLRPRPLETAQRRMESDPHHDQRPDCVLADPSRGRRPDPHADPAAQQVGTQA